MVYGKIMFNNIKEYTPSWIKTIPYSQTVKPSFVRKAQVISRLNADPKVKAFWRFMRNNVQMNPWVWQLYIFFNAYVFTQICYYPWLLAYQSNNQHRTIDAAIAKEKAWKNKQEDAENAEQ